MWKLHAKIELYQILRIITCNLIVDISLIFHQYENIEMVPHFSLTFTLTCNFKTAELQQFQHRKWIREQGRRLYLKKNYQKSHRIVDFVEILCLYLNFSISPLKAA